MARLCLNSPLTEVGAVSSAVEHCLHTAGVTGSIPVPPTNLPTCTLLASPPPADLQAAARFDCPASESPFSRYIARLCGKTKILTCDWHFYISSNQTCLKLLHKLIKVVALSIFDIVCRIAFSGLRQIVPMTKCELPSQRAKSNDESISEPSDRCVCA